MKTSEQGLSLRILTLFSILFFSISLFASGIPDKRNVNIIGVNPPTATDAIPDSGLKQQNEPACGMKPSNPLHIICAFNDYRGVDNPAIGDAWEGYSYSINGGQTWFSDLLPGHPADPNGLGLSFAADPLVAVAPGVAVIAYIAADREENADGGLFLQQMFEVNREAGAPWVPALTPLEVSRGNAGQFIDKPFMLLHPEEPGSGEVSLSATLTDGSSVNRDVPAARLFLSHTVFVGSSDNLKSKMMMSMSDDYGQTWKRKKLSSGNGINQSSSTAANGDNVCTVWRRFEKRKKKNQNKIKQSNAILVACSSNRGKRWSKARVISAEPVPSFIKSSHWYGDGDDDDDDDSNGDGSNGGGSNGLDFSPFDQGTTETSFRTNSYPVITSDGNQFYAFWSQRSPFFARVVFSTSVEGSSWSNPVIVDDAPFGHQFMPSVTTARGTIQLAWYDSRDNFVQRDFVQDILGRLDASNPNGFVDDSTKVIRNKLDIRTVKITDGVVQPSVQVSQYLQGALLESFTEGPDPQPVFGPVQQLEFSFANDRIFKQGSAPFVGDYPNVAAPSFRVENGEWVSNIPVGSTNEPVDFLIAWSDNRDVRGNVWEDLVAPTVYTPASTEGSSAAQTEQDGNSDSEELLADIEKVETPQMAIGLSDSEGEAKKADAEPDLPTGVLGECIPDSPFANRDRSRNQNVYSSIVRPGVSIESPSATKQSTDQVGAVIQRAHVVWLSNNNDAQATYTVTIDNQPEGAPVNGRASFLQVPVAPFADDTGLVEAIDVVIDANSTVARSVFITSTEPNPAVNVSISDGGGVVFGTITLNPDIANPDVQNPDIQNPDVQNPDIQNAEVHNPDIQNPDVQNPDIQNPDIQNPDVQNPDIQNPDVQNPDVQNPDIQNPDIQNPDIQNPDIQNPDIQNSSFDGSDMENPDTAYNPADPADELTPEEREAGYTDITYPITNNGNTTTAFSLDAFLNGNTENLKTQLIAFRSQLTESSRNCMPVTQVENQIIFNKINPDLSLLDGDSNDLIFGDGSAYIAPGETIYVTLRVWGGAPELFEPENLGIKVESQSCNTVDKETGTVVVDCDPPEVQVGVYVPVITTLTETVVTSEIDILNTGAFVVANNLGADPFTVNVNGVIFGTDQGGLSGAWGPGGGDFSVDSFSFGLDNLLSTLQFSGTLNPVSLTIDGLTTGEKYRLQLLFSNDINLTGNDIQVSVEGANYVLDDWQDDPINLVSEFIASDESAVVTFAPGPNFVPGTFPADEPGRAILNGYAVHALPTFINGAPFIGLPASPLILEAGNFEGSIGSFLPDILVTATDDIDSSIDITCQIPDFYIDTQADELIIDVPGDGFISVNNSLAFFCSATDSDGNTTQEFLSVESIDSLAPTLQFGGPSANTTDFTITVPASAAPNTNVWYQDDEPGVEFPNPHVRAFDLADLNPSLDCIPASGSLFPVPLPSEPATITSVTCTAEDASGNNTIESFNVVVDSEVSDAPPVISVPASPYVIVAQTPAGAGITFGQDSNLSVSVTDDLDANVLLTCDAGFTSIESDDVVNLGFNFPGTFGQVQDTVVTCTATDSSGNEDEESFTVRVDDTIGFTWRVDYDFTGQAVAGPYVCIRQQLVYNPGLDTGEQLTVAVFDEDGGPQIGSTAFTNPLSGPLNNLGNEILLSGTQMTDGVGFSIVTFSQANSLDYAVEGRVGQCIGGTPTGFVNGTVTKIN